MANFTVPPVETTFACQSFSLPMDMQRHVVAFDFVRDLSEVVHHMSLFEANDNTFPTPTAQCDVLMPGQHSFVYIWTPGSNMFVLPDNVGFLIGPGATSHYIIQIHYNNPGLATNFIDSSGIILYLLDDLRPHNAATVGIGSFPFFANSIPPNTANFTITTACEVSHLFLDPANGGPPNGTMHVIREFVHMHLTGTRGWINTTRPSLNNQQIHFGDFNPFSFLSQDLHNVQYDVVSGDKLFVTCQWANPTSSPIGPGTSTQLEMCVGFLIYWPAINVLESCNSGSSLGEVCETAPDCPATIFPPPVPPPPPGPPVPPPAPPPGSYP